MRKSTSTIDTGHTRDFTKFAREILLQEASTLTSLADRIDQSFNLAVRMLLELSPGGRVVVSGMGKAGFVGMKLSATLASLGVQSFFLHPAEALHGDLGRYTEHDIALILSKSGETSDITRLLPSLKSVSCLIMSITSAPLSSLGRNSDLVLDLGAIQEAGKLGLAPTSSTTAMMALGDALALAVADAKGVSRERFGELHPAGNLGRRLKRVDEVMRTGDMLCLVEASMIASQVLNRITSTRGRPGAAIVIDESGKLGGIFTDGDLRRCLAAGIEFLNRPISEVMGRNPKTIGAEALVDDAISLMAQHQIDQIVVIGRNGEPLGMLDIQDGLAG